jgi:hypothetical protein
MPQSTESSKPFLVAVLSHDELEALNHKQLLRRRAQLEECWDGDYPADGAALSNQALIDAGTPSWQAAYRQIADLLELRYVQSHALPGLSRAELEALATGTLLTRLAALRRCVESPEQSDYCPKAVARVEGILFKDSDSWRQGYEELQEILAGREHVTRGSKAERQSGATKALGPPRGSKAGREPRASKAESSPRPTKGPRRGRRR